LSAIKDNKTDEVKDLLAKGASANAVNSEGKSALMIAVTGENENCNEITKILIQNGANINVSDNEKKTILMLAINNNKITYDVIELIVSKSSNLNLTDNKGRTPLIDAIENCKRENAFFNDIVKLLISKNANVNIKDVAGKNALMYAVFIGNVELVRLLLSKGADFNAKNKYGNSVSTYAIASGNSDIEELLKSIGAVLARSNRFKDNGNGTITDTTTGLMWEKEPSQEIGRTWQNAMDYAKDLQLRGYSNWRLPSIDEFKKLLAGHLYEDVQSGEEPPYIWLQCNGFVKILPCWFWSSSENDSIPSYAWNVSMGNGNVFIFSKVHTFIICAISVRSGQ